MFYPGFREVIVTRITLASSTSEAIEILSQKRCRPLSFQLSVYPACRIRRGRLASQIATLTAGRRIADRCPVAIERIRINFADD
jgi:hypothetical protein